MTEVYTPRRTPREVNKFVQHQDSGLYVPEHLVEPHTEGGMVAVQAEHPENNDHNHDHDNSGAPITKAWKRLAVWGNATIGAAQLVVGNVITPSVAADGLHNASEVLAYEDQGEAALGEHKLSEQELHKRRKRSHTLLALGSAAVSLKAGVDLGLGHENDPHHSSIYWSGASVSLNVLLLARLLKGTGGKIKDTSVYVRDLYKHMFLVDMPSALFALGGAAVQSGSPKAEQAMAIASGAVGAWAFRPTRKNLSEHTCIAHAHEGEDHHAPESNTETSSALRTVTKRTAQTFHKVREIGVGRWFGYKVTQGLGSGAKKAKEVFTKETETGEHRLRKGAVLVGAAGALAVGAYMTAKFGVSGPESDSQAFDQSLSDILDVPDIDAPDIIPDLSDSLPDEIVSEDAYVQVDAWDRQYSPDGYYNGTVYSELAGAVDTTREQIEQTPGLAAEYDAFVSDVLSDNGLTWESAEHIQPGQDIRISNERLLAWQEAQNALQAVLEDDDILEKV